MKLVDLACSFASISLVASTFLLLILDTNKFLACHVHFWHCMQFWKHFISCKHLLQVLVILVSNSLSLMCILALMKGGGLKKMTRGLVRGGKDLTTSLHVIIRQHSPLSFYTILNSLRPHKMIVEFFMGHAPSLYPDRFRDSQVYRLKLFGQVVQQVVVLMKGYLIMSELLKLKCTVGRLCLCGKCIKLLF